MTAEPFELTGKIAARRAAENLIIAEETSEIAASDAYCRIAEEWRQLAMTLARFPQLADKERRRGRRL